MAQKRKLNRGLEALLGTGLLAKGQDDTQGAQAPAAEQGAMTPAAELPFDAHTQRHGLRRLQSSGGRVGRATTGRHAARRRHQRERRGRDANAAAWHQSCHRTTKGH